jgi:hypothetical protein
MITCASGPRISNRFPISIFVQAEIERKKKGRRKTKNK